MIKAVILDIDGVITDGVVTIDSEGREYKRFCYRDIDAVFEMRRQGLKVGLLTGEATPITEVFKERFEADFFYAGCKDKASAIQEINTSLGTTTEELCFIGDSKHDLEAAKKVGFSACPKDAYPELKALVTWVLNSNGGSGCIEELLAKILLENQ